MENENDEKSDPIKKKIRLSRMANFLRPKAPGFRRILSMKRSQNLIQQLAIPKLIKMALKSSKAQDILQEEDLNTDKEINLNKGYISSLNDILECRDIKKIKKTFLSVLLKPKYLPESIRVKFWLKVSFANKYLSNFKGYYQELLSANEFPDFYQRQIEVDLERSRNKLEYSAELRSTFNVLLVYQRRNPYVGYCQGFNFLVFALIRCGMSEEETFWFFSMILENIMPINYYICLNSVAIDKEILVEALKIVNSGLSKRLEEIELDIAVFTFPWLISLFSIVSFESQDIFYHIISLIIAEGRVVIFKSILAFINIISNVFFETDDLSIILVNIEKKMIEFNDIKLFMKEYKNIYLHEKLIKLIHEKIFETKQEYQKKMYSQYDKRNHKKLNCDQNWPICHYFLENRRYIKIDYEEYAFTTGKEIINSKFQDFPIENGFLLCLNGPIGYITHICPNSRQSKSQKSITAASTDEDIQDSKILSNSMIVNSSSQTRHVRFLSNQLEYIGAKAKRRINKAAEAENFKFIEKLSKEVEEKLDLYAQRSTSIDFCKSFIKF